MKRKENKPIKEIPVPVGIGFTPHPSKFKLSPQRTSFKNQKECYKPTIRRDIRRGSKLANDRRGIDFEKFKDSLLYRSSDIVGLKKLYFKGWLLSR